MRSEYIEIVFQDQYLGRSDMWRLGKQLQGDCVHIGQDINFMGSPTGKIQNIYINGRNVNLSRYQNRPAVDSRMNRHQRDLLLLARKSFTGLFPLRSQSLSKSVERYGNLLATVNAILKRLCILFCLRFSGVGVRRTQITPSRLCSFQGYTILNPKLTMLPVH